MAFCKSSRTTTTIDLGLVLCLLVLVLLAGFGGSDLAQDRAECTDKLVSLTSCLSYVNGEAKAPTLDCCNGFKDVVERSNKCICILLKDRDDPNLGIKINATLAVKLPSICHAPTNITDCINILHLAPTSKEAKDFEYLGKLAAKNGSTTPAPSTASNASAGGTASCSDDRRWPVAKDLNVQIGGMGFFLTLG
ncbi:non-specific lipid transfer protein GPI-anchored 6-like isoform X2 [Prosopis cineraria]|uniref:non-specific lipid transfer protein GPI-anchored 6-like isoform X2 n=1 Tax=Prosopis cineraria TaxID=364024 RepID=UPI00240FDBC1|nr:non-specific lipid transfer protein GPI-anchored 6-like isoform X2 [Prosopis cineraria]